MEYLAFINLLSKKQDNSNFMIKRRGRDSNSRSPDGEPALKAGALGRTLLPQHN